jgi:hypothetical protein
MVETDERRRSVCVSATAPTVNCCRTPWCVRAPDRRGAAGNIGADQLVFRNR